MNWQVRCQWTQVSLLNMSLSPSSLFTGVTALWQGRRGGGQVVSHELSLFLASAQRTQAIGLLSSCVTVDEFFCLFCFYTFLYIGFFTHINDTNIYHSES